MICSVCFHAKQLYVLLHFVCFEWNLFEFKFLGLFCMCLVNIFGGKLKTRIYLQVFHRDVCDFLLWSLTVSWLKIIMSGLFHFRSHFNGNNGVNGVFYEIKPLWKFLYFIFASSLFKFYSSLFKVGDFMTN